MDEKSFLSGRRPEAYDKFHLSKHLNDALNQVRRQEHKQLLKRNSKVLANTKSLWQSQYASLSPERQAVLQDLIKRDLKTGEAWGLKEAFSEFGRRRDASFAKVFFCKWHNKVMESGLKPMIRVAKTFKRHIARILRWYECFIDNGIAEGFNPGIQTLKANARGYRSFENYRIAVLFNFGRLNLQPVV